MISREPKKELWKVLFQLKFKFCKISMHHWIWESWMNWSIIKQKLGTAHYWGNNCNRFSCKPRYFSLFRLTTTTLANCVSVSELAREPPEIPTIPAHVTAASINSDDWVYHSIQYYLWYRATYRQGSRFYIPGRLARFTKVHIIVN